MRILDDVISVFVHANPDGHDLVAIPGVSLPHLKALLEAGCTILAIGGSTRLGRDLGSPMANHLIESVENNQKRPIPPERFYFPSSVLRMRLDRSGPLACRATTWISGSLPARPFDWPMAREPKACGGSE